MSVTMRAAGTSAVLIECGDLEEALSTCRTLTNAVEAGHLAADDLVPAARTVLVVGGEAHHPRRLISKLERLIASKSGLEIQPSTCADTLVPVVYEGDDLENVANLTGLSIQHVIERHTAASYTVAFTGFAPGFAYLSGGDPLLNVPRHGSPRLRIRPGSVGIAGQFSGIYPRESPGGWQILGFTERVMWDERREQPAALLLGNRVRFLAKREHTEAINPATCTAERSSTCAADNTKEPTDNPNTTSTQARAKLKVLKPGLQSLIEDVGRSGVTGLGVGQSGAATPRAYRHANRLVGNRPNAAAIELCAGEFSLEALADAVLAITGAERSARIIGPLGTRTAPHDAAFRLSTGEQLTLSSPQRGWRTIVGVRGGIAAPHSLGSRSYDLLAKLGPQPLVSGQELAISTEELQAVSLPDSPDPPHLPVSGERTTLRVLIGPRDNWFDSDSLATLTSATWEVTPHSDRVGVRLAGPSLTRAPSFINRELPSEGMVLGGIQVPPDGQPVLFLVDHPVTGGYPVIAVVHEDDVELAAQLQPGCFVAFVATEASLSPMNDQEDSTCPSPRS